MTRPAAAAALPFNINNGWVSHFGEELQSSAAQLLVRDRTGASQNATVRRGAPTTSAGMRSSSEALTRAWKRRCMLTAGNLLLCINQINGREFSRGAYEVWTRLSSCHLLLLIFLFLFLFAGLTHFPTNHRPESSPVSSLLSVNSKS